MLGKFRLINLLTIVIIFLVMNITVFADSKTASINISATIVPSCEAGTANGTSISFGTLNFGSVPNLDQNIPTQGQTNHGGIRIKCTKNTSYTVYLDADLNSSSTATRYLSNGSALISYNLYTDPSHTNIWNNTAGITGLGDGKENWIPVYGMVFKQAPPPPGTYTDKINVTISY